MLLYLEVLKKRSVDQWLLVYGYRIYLFLLEDLVNDHNDE